MVAANISLSNFNFELFGKGVFVIIAFALITVICFGISALIKRAVGNYKNRRISEQLSKGDVMKNITIQDLMKMRKIETPEKDKEDFFFGSVSDWRTMK